MQNETRVIADTNIFFECKRLEELPWQDLAGDPVVVLLTKPVLEEIDKHKKANGRTRDRALEISKRVRGILEAGVDEVELCRSGPKVVLRLVPNTPVDPELAGALDYGKNDDRLIGILSTLHKGGGTPVLLLTHDTGPASSANGFGLPYQLVPDRWLRPPQQTEEQKAKAALEAELERFKKQEPQITGVLLEPNTNPVDITRYRDVPLTAAQIDGALVSLEKKHPMRIDFNAPPSETKRYPTGRVDEISYTPPTGDEIGKYQQTDYREWLSRCRTMLEGLHGHRELKPERISMKIAFRNEGNRPALNAFVSFRCEGDCLLFRADDDAKDQDAESHEVDSSAKDLTIRLPKPPTPPKITRSVRTIQEATEKSDSGKKGLDSAELWVERAAGKHLAAMITSQPLIGQAFGPLHDSRLMSTLGHLCTLGDGFRSSLAVQTPSHLYDINTLDPITSSLHDPEAFYYKKWRAGHPCATGGLTCDRWRHQSETEVFEFEVIMTGSETSNGVLICSVHAENLTFPFELKVPLRRKVIDRDLQDDLDLLVEKC